jgi:hypothetical protein
MPNTTKLLWVSRVNRFIGWVTALLAFGGVIFAIIHPSVSTWPPISGPQIDGSNFRTLVAAYTQNLKFPTAELREVHTVAEDLAIQGFNAPTFWVSWEDRALTLHEYKVASEPLIWRGQTSPQPNPEFRKLPLAYAVALLPDLASLPPHTPILWTRGLLTDGTWRQDSPYSGKGGWIATADGQIWLVWADRLPYSPQNGARRVGDILKKWGTDDPTNNIAEALPSGTRWVESTLTPKQTSRLSGSTPLEQQRRWRLIRATSGPLALILVFGLVGSSFVRARWSKALCIPGGLIAAIFFWTAFVG